MRIYEKNPDTGLREKLKWYSTTYGISLSTVRRHRRFLDQPRALLMMLIASRSRIEDLIRLRTLQDYVQKHCPK